MNEIIFTESLNKAIELKIKKGCPHIHFIIEKKCDNFTGSLVWLEVLSRAVNQSIKNGCCIVSYKSMLFDLYAKSLSEEENDILLKGLKTVEEKLKLVHVSYVK